MSMIKEKEKNFAEGLCFKKFFLLFVLGSFVGSFYEEIVFFVQYKEWTVRHDLLYGPFSTLYGFGMILFLLFLGWRNKKRGVVKTFLYATFIGGVFEYLASFFLELFLGMKFWDYTGMFLSIEGRTTLPFMLVWGAMGTFVVKVVYPFLSKWIEKIPKTIGNILYYMLLVFFVVDMLLSYSVFIRMVLRNRGVAPRSFVGEFYDVHYNNEYMYNKFPILKGK